MVMGAAVQGVLAAYTANRTALTEGKPDIRPELVKRNSARTAMLTLLIGKSVNKNFSPVRQRPVLSEGPFSWFESDQIDFFTTVTTAATAAAVNVVPTTVNIFSRCSLIMVMNNGGNDGEIMWVTDTWAYTSPLVVVRGVGGTTARPLIVGARLIRLAPAVPESGITAVGTIEGNRTAYSGVTQEMWREISLTKRRRAVMPWTGVYDWPQEQLDAWDGLREDTARSFYLQHDVDTTTTNVAATFLAWIGAGLSGIISTHLWDAKGCGYDQYCDYIGAYTRGNPRAGSELMPVVFCGNRAFQQIGRWASDRVQTRSGDSVFGFNVQEVIVNGAPFGSTIFHYDPVLDNTTMENDAIGLNLADVEFRYLKTGPPDNKGWQVQLQDGQGEDITAVGSTDKAERLAWNVGLQVMREPRHFRISNFANVWM